MLYSIPKTRMLTDAQNSLSPFAKPRSIFYEILIFLLVAMIGTSAITVAQSILTTVMMFFDAGYYEVIDQTVQSGSADMSALTEYLDAFTANLPGYAYAAFLALSAFYILAAIIYCKRFEKRSRFSMGFNKKGMIPEYLFGVAIGAVMISLPALVCLLTGSMSFSYGTSSPAVIIFFFLAFILQGMGEEVLFRGYLLMSLTRRNKEWVAIIVSSVMFSLFHLPNSGFSAIAFLNITLFGVFAAVFMLKRGSIWAASAIHTAWNFLQGNVFGVSVSGNPKFESVFNSVSNDYGALWNGGAFGLEGGLAATTVLLVALLFALMMPAKKSEVDTVQINF